MRSFVRRILDLPPEHWIIAAPRRVIELGFTEEDVVELSGLRVRGQNQRAGSNGRRCCPLIVRRRFLRSMLQR